MASNLGQKASRGAVWASIDRFGSMGIQFVVNLVLARLLLPEDFGIIGMLTIFIVVSQTLIDGGFGSAIIQKKSPSEADYSTIFYWNIGFSLLLYLILYAFSPLIAHFYKMPLLCNVLRVIALSLIVTGIVNIQRTRLQKELAFKTIAIVNLSSTIVSALIAITMAAFGYGVWSLVAMQLIYGFTVVIILAIVTRWIPKFIFSKNSMKELFGFGGFILAATVLQTICQNIQGLIIGKKFSATQMGYYSQAYKLNQVTSYSIPQVIVQVMFPVYSSLQDDKPKLNEMVLMNMRVVSFIIFPILATLIVIANPLIEGLYGGKWMPSVPYFRILCVGGFFVCLQNLNFYAVAAVGKSKSLFIWSFYKWGFLLATLLIGMNFGMMGILWGMVLSSINIYFTNAYLAQKHTGLNISKQLLSILPTLLTVSISIISGLIFEYFYHSQFISAILTLLIYILLSYTCRLKALNETIEIIKKILPWRKYKTST